MFFISLVLIVNSRALFLYIKHHLSRTLCSATNMFISVFLINTTMSSIHLSSPCNIHYCQTQARHLLAASCTHPANNYLSVTMVIVVVVNTHRHLLICINKVDVEVIMNNIKNDNCV